MKRSFVAFALVALGCPKGGDDTSAGATTGGGASSTGAGSAATSTGGASELQYCPGEPEVGDPCREDADCLQGQGMYCSPTENDCPGAGCPMFCQGDAECGDGFVCVFGGTGCCAGQTSECVPACTPDSCAAGEECLPDGHCAPIACDAGFTCPNGQRCEPAAEGADGHGCAVIPCDQPDALPCGELFECVAGGCSRLACQASADCPCGTCVQGRCYPRPWLCTQPNP